MSDACSTSPSSRLWFDTRGRVTCRWSRCSARPWPAAANNGRPASPVGSPPQVRCERANRSALPAVTAALVDQLAGEQAAGRGADDDFIFCTRTGRPLGHRTVALRGVEKAALRAGWGSRAARPPPLVLLARRPTWCRPGRGGRRSPDIRLLSGRASTPARSARRSATGPRPAPRARVWSTFRRRAARSARPALRTGPASRPTRFGAEPEAGETPANKEVPVSVQAPGSIRRAGGWGRLGCWR